MKSLIGHPATICRVENHRVWLKINVESACASCHAKGACSSMDCAEKEIEVITHETFMIGDKVKVSIRQTTGHLAVFLAYIAPFILLISSIAGLQFLGISETTSALLGLCTLATYFLSFMLCKNWFKKRFTFTVQRQQT